MLNKKNAQKLWTLLTGVMVISLLLIGCNSQPAVPTEVPYPTRPITYVIPFDPGGASDKIAQQQVVALKRILGQEITLDYKAGSGGATGWAEVAKSSPDGYTIVATNLPHIIIQPMYGKVNYQTAQLDVIALFASTPSGLGVLKSSPYKTLQEYLAAAKAEPGKMKLGISSELGATHMTALLLQKLTGTKFDLVFYTGSAPQMTAFLAGEIPAIMGNSDDFTKYKEQVRALALASDARFPDLADVPTFKEQGIDLVSATDRGIAVAAGTPAPIVKKLEAAFLEISKTPEFQATMKKQGFAQLVMGHDEVKAYLEKLTASYKQLADYFK
jgi:tripartite-type tricarboxylate transporter receptor subunit TctC